jgi:methionine synthase II (cobalamin-independent)
MFADKARAYPSEPPFRYYTNIVGSWPYPQTLDKAEKAWQEQTLAFYKNSS